MQRELVPLLVLSCIGVVVYVVVVVDVPLCEDVALWHDLHYNNGWGFGVTRYRGCSSQFGNLQRC